LDAAVEEPPDADPPDSWNKAILLGLTIERANPLDMQTRESVNAVALENWEICKVFLTQLL